jgi:arylsulfatase A-like enzyme
VRGRFDHVVDHPAGMPRGGGRSESDVLDKPRGAFRAPEPTAKEVRALTEVTRQRAEALYVLDREVGRTVEHLKRLRAWRNTVFVFTSDNGYYLGEHRKRSGKTTAHEPSLRVPLLMTGPGVPAGESRFDPATTMDLTATVADLARATDRFPYVLEGRSLLDVLRSGDQGWDRPVLTEALFDRSDGKDHSWRVKGYPKFQDERGSIGIRLARYKVTVYHTGFVELYDLARDPNELDGVQKDPAYRDVKKAMLELWWRVKDCRAAECVGPVPAELAISPTETRSLTRLMFDARVARYGH